MTQLDRIDEILEQQRLFFQSGQTHCVSFRVAMLKKLKACILRHEAELTEALHTDLGKSSSESYLCEIGMVLSSLSYFIRNTKRLARKHRVPTPVAQFHSISYTQRVPYGNTLIMSPWNYPVLLTLDPIAHAIAAGNTVMVKPSAYAPATASLLATMLRECFPEEYVAVIQGGREENTHLLEKKFDFVFFTGSQRVGKEVLRHTAEYLTPTVLELGGKSPVLVDRSCDLPLAAKRIVFGKVLNCGQTCVAPDYILCDSQIKEALIAELKKQIIVQLGQEPLSNPKYGHIINQKHFQRICGLMEPKQIAFGGRTNPETLQIEPTILDHVSWDDPVMGEEIFGPLLPVLSYDRFEEVYDLLKNRPKPLALYLFSTDQAHIDFVSRQIPFGGGCINDTIIHLATEQMGFGGVGESGMGSYHGKTGLDAFSHTKSIVHKKNWIDLPMRYQPYRAVHDKLIRYFLR